MSYKNDVLTGVFQNLSLTKGDTAVSEFKKIQSELRKDYETLGDENFWKKYEPLFPTKNLCEDKDFSKKPIVDILKEGLENNTLRESMLAILALGLHTREKIQKVVAKGKIPDFLIHNSAKKNVLEKKYAWILENPWFLENAWKNYLRILGILDPVSYDAVFSSSGYNLVHEKNPSQFASNVSRFSFSENTLGNSLMKGNILSIGPGPNLRDEKLFIENAGRMSYPIHIYVNDVSQFVIDTIEKNISEEKKRQKFLPYYTHIHLDGEPKGTVSKLKELISQGKTMDCVYNLSVFHYFHNKKLQQILSLIYKVLKPGGYLTFAVKVPGTTFDGVGIPIVNRSAHLQAPDNFGELPTPRVWESTWMGLDGQVRTFRDYQTLEKMISDSGFNTVSASRIGIEKNYEFDSQEDDVRFYQFIAQKPKN